MHAFTGSCYCGNVRFEAQLSKAAADYAPRACDCDFCSKHGAVWLSDADGALCIQVNDSAQLRRYRQGAELAEFLNCGNCGVLVAVCYQQAADCFAAINARVAEAAGFAPAVAASPKRLSAAEKVARWQQLWFRAVITGDRP